MNTLHLNCHNMFKIWGKIYMQVNLWLIIIYLVYNISYVLKKKKQVLITWFNFRNAKVISLMCGSKWVWNL